jgi:hypothetical protein
MGYFKPHCGAPQKSRTHLKISNQNLNSLTCPLLLQLRSIEHNDLNFEVNYDILFQCM